MRIAVSADLDEGVLADLDRLAEVLDRPRDALIAEAVQRFIARENGFRSFIEEGDRDFENDDYLSHEDFVRELRERSGRKDAA